MNFTMIFLFENHVSLDIKGLYESPLQIYHNIVKVAIAPFLYLGFGVV